MAMSLRKRMRRGDTTLGSILTIGSAQVAELMAHAGFDWLWIDMEHGAMDVETALHMLQAVQGHDVLGLVRVMGNDVNLIKRVLDLGADGIIVPMVNSAEEARGAVQAAKYPPEGVRGVGLARAQGYGFHFGEYVKRANEDIAVIVQVENIKAVEQIDEIVRVPGIDVVFVGPYDLSGSLGMLGEVSRTEVEEAVQKVVSSCKREKIPIGILEMTPERVKRRAKEGFQFIACAADNFLLFQAVETFLADTGLITGGATST